MKIKPADQHGFTLIELVLVISLLGILLAITTVSLFRPVSKTNLKAISIDVFSLLREAQNKAINTDTSGDPQSNDWAVHFESSSYTLFKGTSYSATEPTNFVVNAPSNITISPSLPCPSPPGDCNNIVFQRISGEVLAYDALNNTVCITQASSNKQVLLTINFVGVVNIQDGC